MPLYMQLYQLCIVNKGDSIMTDFNKVVSELAKLDCKNIFGEDFFLTWEKSDDELKAVWAVADALRALREQNISTKVFDSGLGISLFRDNSTRTRFSFASACNLLGLEVQDLDEGKSQIAHGETVRETANMVSFMADVIGIRDDMYIGKGNAYMHAVSDAVKEGFEDGVLEQRPNLVNLQCDIDHPTQVMADAAHIIKEFGGIENLRAKSGYDLGLLSILRQTFIRTARGYRLIHAPWHGSCFGPSGRL